MTKTVLELPHEMACALAWTMMIHAPDRPCNLLPYLYGADGSKRPAVRDWAQWHGGGARRAQPINLWREWGRYAARRSITAWATLPGAIGNVVVDVDAPHLLGRVLDTYGETEIVVRTPRGGYHLYYRAPASPPVSRTGVLGPGTYDIKSIGGTAHAPGTRRPDGKMYVAQAPGLVDGALMRGADPALPACSLYEVMPIFPVARLDEVWATHHPATDDLPLDGEPRYIDTADGVESVRRYMDAAGPAVYGNGHNHTFKLLRKIGDLGVSEELALELAEEWDQHNEPPWGLGEIRKKVRDAYKTRKSPIGWRMEELAHVDAPDGDDIMDDAEILALLRAGAT